MDEILTDVEKLIVEYFSLIGMSLAKALSAMAHLCNNPEAALEMLTYLLETNNTDCDQVYEKALEITLKYPRWETDED